MVAMAVGDMIQGKDDLYDVLLRMAELALRFGKIDRTGVLHPDQVTPESDTDHTVMLGWVAPALAARLYPDTLDVGLVAQFALVHDAPEVYAGDTQTLSITPEGRADKARREAEAVRRLACEFGEELPWFSYIIGEYEGQERPEARFVRAVDKVLPKLVHFLDGCKGLIDFGITIEDFEAMLAEQGESLRSYAGEFTALLELREALARCLIGFYRDRLAMHARMEGMIAT